ncbi:MAG: DUF4404 family protein [Spirochaetes bacterium]|nr:DUF4404 family protein [Spirochaetota bacterium]
MSMNKLKKHLEELKSEANKLKAGDNETREKMTVLISEIEHLLENPDDSAHRSLVINNLQDHVENFEIKHPDLTGVLNQIMVMLGNMGI